MPLLPSQNKIPILDFKCKLPADLIADIQAYATAIESDPSYVVSRAIEKLTADSPKQKRGPKPKPNAAAA